MDNNDPKLVRPGDPRVPCFAILGRDTSDLQLVNMEGASSSTVKISDHRSLGIVNIIGEVFAVTEMEILKLRSDGMTDQMSPLPELDVYTRLVLFQRKIFILRPDGKSMLCFDPADNSLTDDLPGCGLGFGFCASATDEFICAMGGETTEIWSMKFDPLKLKWKKKAQMRKARRSGSAAATLDGKICVMGGSCLYHRTSVEYYNPGNNSWTEISNMNADRLFFSTCVDGDRLYAVGGDRECKESGFYQQSVEVYDKNKWTVMTKFQTKDRRTHACFWPHGSHQPGDNEVRASTLNNFVADKVKVKTLVGQLATGNADVTEQDTGSNYVTGLQENTDHSVTAEKASYGVDQETRSGGNFNNCLFNITASQVAIGGDINMSETKNIAGDVSTVVNAPVGQLATGNANITEQGAGSSIAPGDVPTVVDAQVGQVSTGNANFTEQDAGNSYGAGDVPTVVNVPVGQVSNGNANLTEQDAGNSDVPDDVPTVVDATVGQVSTSDVNITEQDVGNSDVPAEISALDRAITAGRDILINLPGEVLVLWVIWVHGEI